MKVCSATFFWTSSKLSGDGTLRGPGGPGGPAEPGGPGEPGAGESAGMSDAAGGVTAFSLGVNSGVTCSGDASEKWTHFSSVLTATDLGDSTGPKMLSRSLMDGSFSILASVAAWSFPVVKVVDFKFLLTLTVTCIRLEGGWRQSLAGILYHVRCLSGHSS